MKKLSEMNEKELRDYKVPYPETKEELLEIIDSLTDREHEYGTCVYAMSIAATATFNYIAHKLGVTGFQSSCADLDILTRTRDHSLKFGFRIINYRNLLYPQYLDSEHFPNWVDLENDKDLMKRISKEAKRLLDEADDMVHSDVRKRWEYLANLTIL